jgi:hypothetical protein
VSGDLKERIEELLKSLGGDPDTVADTLRAKGIKGNRDDGCECPIAKLIAVEIPEATRPKAEWSDNTGAWFVSFGYVRTPDGEVDPPRAVSDFIDAFDNGIGVTPWEAGEYPYADLEEGDR